MALKIGIADDHLLILKGVESMLQTYTNCTLLFTALNGTDTLAALQKELPDVLLLDIQLPDIDGTELCRLIRSRHPKLRIIALTNHQETHYVRKMINHGANGYLLKNADPQLLITAIETVYKGVQFIDPNLEKAMMAEMLSGKKRTPAHPLLTKRENEILGMIGNALTNQQIADELFISLRTVETHRMNIMQKLDVKNTASLVKEALLRGLIR